MPSIWKRFRAVISPSYRTAIQLESAAAVGDAVAVFELLKRRKPTSSSATSAFVAACAGGHVNCVRVLLLECSHIDVRAGNDRALNCAILGGHFDVVAVLFQVVSPAALNLYGPFTPHFNDGTLMRVIYVWIKICRDDLVEMALPHAPNEMFWPSVMLAHHRSDKSLFDRLMKSDMAKTVPMDIIVSAMLGLPTQLSEALRRHESSCRYACHQHAMKAAISAGHFECFQMVQEDAHRRGICVEFLYEGICCIGSDTKLSASEEMVTHAAAACQVNALRKLLSLNDVDVNNRVMRLFALVDAARADAIDALMVLLQQLPAVQPTEIAEALLVAADENSLQAMRLLVRQPGLSDEVLQQVSSRSCCHRSETCGHSKALQQQQQQEESECIWTLADIRRAVDQGPVVSTAFAA